MESQWFRSLRAWTLWRERLHLCFHAHRNSSVLLFASLPKDETLMLCKHSLWTVHTFPSRCSVSCLQKLLQEFIRKQQPFLQQPYCEQIAFWGGGVPFRRPVCGTLGNAKSVAAGSTPLRICPLPRASHRHLPWCFSPDADYNVLQNKGAKYFHCSLSLFFFFTQAFFWFSPHMYFLQRMR